MLRTNSKQAQYNLKKWIMEGYDPEYDRLAKEFPITDSSDFSVYAYHIYNQFYIEKVKLDNRYAANRISEYALFEEWVSGLCSMIDSSYYYSTSAKNRVMQILEESEWEARRFSEEDAEKLLTRLIYNAIKKAISANDVEKMIKGGAKK